MVTWLLQKWNVWPGIRGSHPGVSFQSELNFSKVRWLMSWGPRNEVALPWSQAEMTGWQQGWWRGWNSSLFCHHVDFLQICVLWHMKIWFLRERGLHTARWGRKGGSRFIHCHRWVQGHPQNGSVRTWGQKISCQTWASPGPGRVSCPWEPRLVLLLAAHQVPCRRPRKAWLSLDSC